MCPHHQVGVLVTVQVAAPVHRVSERVEASLQSGRHDNLDRERLSERGLGRPVSGLDIRDDFWLDCAAVRCACIFLDELINIRRSLIPDLKYLFDDRRINDQIT